jgi:hypothetical protein
MDSDTPSAKRPELADFMCFAIYSANLTYPGTEHHDAGAHVPGGDGLCAAQPRPEGRAQCAHRLDGGRHGPERERPGHAQGGRERLWPGPEEFAVLQKSVARLRDKLLKSGGGQ